MPVYSPGRHARQLLQSLLQQLINALNPHSGTALVLTANPALMVVGTVITMDDDETEVGDIETAQAEEHKEDEAPVMQAQNWQDVIDDSPGINTPPKDITKALFNKRIFKDAVNESDPILRSLTMGPHFMQAMSDEQTIAELRKMRAEDDMEDGTSVGDEDAIVTVLSPSIITRVCPGYFPPPPAITQSSALLRRELVAYFFKTKVDLVFNWRDTLADVPILTWLRSVDPLWLHTIQGVSVVGLGQYVPSSNSQSPSPENAHSVDDLESYLHDGGHYEDGGSWSDCVRINLGLSFKTKGKTAKLDVEFKDKVEYQASPDILEYKEKVFLK